MNILGINAFHGDASAALLRDGELVAAIEEERLNRRKHCAGFPALAVRAVLANSGVAPEEIEARIDAVTADEVRELARELLAEENLGLCIIGPVDESAIAWNRDAA